MTETPKRLAPKPATLRELFLKSGNLCAFPNCTSLMMNEKGVFIGQLCHIEAAEPGGQRFNPAMTNEERRAMTNLMLMCYEHHKVTDDVNKFPTADLMKMKADHEARFSSPDRAILQRLTDWTLADEPKEVKNLRRLDEALGWNTSDNDLREEVTNMNEYIERFSRVPIEVRKFVGSISQRMDRMKDTSAVLTDAGSASILISDVKDAFKLSDSFIRKKLAQLESYALGDLDEINTDLGSQPMIRIWAPERGPSWLDIVAFCKATNTRLESFTEDLDFSQLDK